MDKILFVIEEIEENDIKGNNIGLIFTYRVDTILNAKTEIHKVKEYDGSNKHVIRENTLYFLFDKYATKIRCWKNENVFTLKTKAAAIDFTIDLGINQLNSII